MKLLYEIFNEILIEAWKLTPAFEAFKKEVNGLTSLEEILLTVKKYFKPATNKYFGTVDLSAEGAFRNVYEIDHEFVIKVATDQSGVVYNKLEVNNILNTTYSDLFPKFYERAKNYEWFVVEKIRPLTSYKEILEFFPEVSALWNEFHDIFGTSAYGVLIDFLNYSTAKTHNNVDELDYLKTRQTDGEAAFKLFDKLSINMSPLLARFEEYNTRITSRASELIKTTNVGVTKDGRLVLADASIFGSYEADFLKTKHK